MAIKEWSAFGPPVGTNESMPPVFTAYMRQMSNKLRASNSYVDCEPVLKAHRKALGLGVHGPLKIKGILRLSLDTYEDRTQMVATVRPQLLQGPKGSWSATR